jgi:hypothetical protein
VRVRLGVRKAAFGLLADAPAAPNRVSVIVLAQLTWALLRYYRLDNTALIATVDSLLSRVALRRRSTEHMMTAPQWCRRGSADVAGYLAAALNREAGAAPTYTFDEPAASSPAQVS